MPVLLTNERDTETKIDNILRNKGWLDSVQDKNRTVWKQDVKTEEQRCLLQRKRPDFVLYPKGRDNPLAVIEAKTQGRNIHTALEQGIEYAERIKAPIVFATDGVFTKSFHLLKKQPLFLNEEEVKELLEYQTALKYLKKNKVDTLDKRVVKSRGELIGIFSKANDLLREEGLQAGIERFSEFSNLLFLKIFSELEEIKRNSGKPSLIEPYMLWENFKDKEGSELISHLNNIVIQEFSGNYGKDIFKTLSIKNPENLKAIIDSLSDLQLSDTNADIKGDAFEYFIKAYSASNPADLGEIFTPRHIVQTMVKLLDPKIGETVYDPFCGTGGMLITAFKHMMGTMAQTEFNLEKIQKKTFYGTELTKTAKIAKMNMILAGDGHSNINQADSYQHPVNQEHDVLITNYPFAQKTRYGDLYDIPSRNGDVISPQHCFRALKDGGRMAFIAPEGFLFRQDRALRDVRKFLLNNANLKSIISLPQGCFMPYNGVKASILYFDEVRTGKTRDYFWFFDVKNDGFTLDKRRAKIDGGNDLETVLSERDNATATEEYLQEQGVHKIQVQEVEDNDYSLSCKQLLKEPTVNQSEWPMVELGEVCAIKSGLWKGKKEPFTKAKIIRNANFKKTGGIDKSKIIEHEVEMKQLESRRLQYGDIILENSGGSPSQPVGRVVFFDIESHSDYSFSNFTTRIRASNSKEIHPHFLFRLLDNFSKRKRIQNLQRQTNGIRNLDKKAYFQTKIPLPPLAVQEEIVKELDGYQKIIDGCRQVVDNYKPLIEIDPEWEMVELGGLASLEYGKPLKKEDRKDGNYPVYGSNGVLGYHSEFIVKGPFIVVGRKGSAGAVVYSEKSGFPIDTTFYIKKTDKRTFLKFLFFLIQDRLKDLNIQSAVPGLNRNDAYKIKIPLPSLTVQEEIVKRIEKEREAINRCKWLIETYTQKIQDRVDKLWKG